MCIYTPENGLQWTREVVRTAGLTVTVTGRRIRERTPTLA